MENNKIIQNPFAVAGKYENINQGVVEIESNKAIAEAQGRLVIAKRFPRDRVAAFNNLMIACSRSILAEKALYSYPRDNQMVSGASIRLAEEAARCWGNVDFGIKELSQKDGESEMMAYCWDMETNVISSQQFVVKHIKDTKNGSKNLTKQRDIYENNANMANRRLRSRILAILPPDLIESAIEKCKQTLAGDSKKPLEDSIKELATCFGSLGINKVLLDKRLGKSMDIMTFDEVADYIGIYNSIIHGESRISDWFDVKVPDDKTISINKKLMGEADNNAK
ncbi:MAG: hypothetical protein IJZ64_01880 [Ruminococcus sp.]|nr:hypothetical protein [Ruminococcus sp.]